MYDREERGEEYLLLFISRSADGAPTAHSPSQNRGKRKESSKTKIQIS
jgi:hypothetical protein